MTREEFVRGYANRSGLSDKYASLGIVDVGGHTLFALPCACGDDTCDGWAMVSGSTALDHLFFNAPKALREAYRNAVSEHREALSVASPGRA